MLCQDAEAAYERAAMFTGKVFEDAKGNACTYCDIGRIGSIARLLLDRETCFRDNPGHDVSLSALWNDWHSWSQSPACQALGAPPLPDCGATGSYPSSRLNASQGLAMSGVPYMNECEGRCDQNDRCRSFDFDANGGVCPLHDRTRDEAGLLPAPQGYAHLPCGAR